MALTDNEQKMFKAYNIGYLLSQHEPVLLDKIIKRNKDNEFVKMMSVGRDHHHFHANMPRKDNTKGFRNGFYNGRTLAEHQPGMITKLINSKELQKDFKRGLEAAQKEYSIKQIGKKIDAMPKVPSTELRKDEHFRKGFNVGYRLAENHGYVFNAATSVNEQYSKFLQGAEAGKQQYQVDLAKLREREPEGKLYPNDRPTALHERMLNEYKADSIKEAKNKQIDTMERTDTFNDVPMPKWMQKKEPDKESKDADKSKTQTKNKNIDLDR